MMSYRIADGFPVRLSVVGFMIGLGEGRVEENYQLRQSTRGTSYRIFDCGFVCFSRDLRKTSALVIMLL